jgi:hypothetical protein
MNLAVPLSLIGGIVLAAGSALERVRVPRIHATPPAGIVNSEAVTVVTKTTKVSDRIGEAWAQPALRSLAYIPQDMPIDVQPYVPKPKPKESKAAAVVVDYCGVTKQKVYYRKGKSWRCR